MRTPLWLRLLWARLRLQPKHSNYRVVYEDPASLDDPVKVLVPSPNWVAAALAGGVIPPVEAYWRDRQRPNGAKKEHVWAKPIAALTELEAIEYLIKKDVPPRVWMDANRLRFRIVLASQIPTDKAQRSAWRLRYDSSFED